MGWTDEQQNSFETIKEINSSETSPLKLTPTPVVHN
jgi:hypothetical protein